MLIFLEGCRQRYVKTQEKFKSQRKKLPDIEMNTEYPVLTTVY